MVDLASVVAVAVVSHFALRVVEYNRNNKYSLLLFFVKPEIYRQVTARDSLLPDSYSTL